jgi:hypothetical protein
MNSPRITDYGSFYFCETCDAIALADQWDADARMCRECAKEL